MPQSAVLATTDDMKSCWSNIPDNSLFTINYGHNDCYAIFNDLCLNSVSSFVDVENSICSFNSEEFKELLSFANDFGNDCFDKSETTRGDFLVAPIILKGFQQFHQILWDMGSNEDITFIGFPSKESSNSFIGIRNTFAVSSGADPAVKQGAWEFIRYLEGYSYQYNSMIPDVNDQSYDNSFYEAGTERFFPMNNEAFEKRASEAEKSKNNICWMQGVEYDMGKFTHDAYERLKNIINKAKHLDFGSGRLQGIIYDEVCLMMSGEESPQKASENIQSKATILLNE